MILIAVKMLVTNLDFTLLTFWPVNGYKYLVCAQTVLNNALDIFSDRHSIHSIKHLCVQGGRSCASAQAALTERLGSSTKGRTPNILYFVAKPSIVAIFALFERLS